MSNFKFDDNIPVSEEGVVEQKVPFNPFAAKTEEKKVEPALVAKVEKVEAEILPITTRVEERPDVVSYLDTISDETALQQYLYAEDEVKRAKDILEYHKQVMLGKFGDQCKIGTTNLTAGKFKLKIVQSEKVSVEIFDNNYFNQILGWIAQHPQGGAEVANTIIRWKPELNKKLFDSLPDDIRSALGQFLVTKATSLQWKVTFADLTDEG